MLQPNSNRHNIHFWTLNISGWLAYAMLNYLIGIEANKRSMDYILPSLVYAIGGILICWGLRRLFRWVWHWRPTLVIVSTGLGVVLATWLFTCFRVFVYVLYYEPAYVLQMSWSDYFSLKEAFTSLYVLGTWSGLYFGIKNYRTIQDQNERLLRATSLAHESQLKLLRYQLNPHFLFNTLNAVSTLILEQENTLANRMVTRLSSFLRKSLDNDPMQKIPLKQELESLRLYLDIESTRFEDRLRVNYDIAAEARDALVPAMLLQALIENAVRHTVEDSEDGGTIDIAGRIENGKLCLRIADNGADNSTGIPAAETLEISQRKTPGISNTRDRLGVIYGDQYELNLQTLEPYGLTTEIRIPLERNQ